MKRLVSWAIPVARFFLQQYWRISRPLTAGARVLVIDASGKVLLVRHTYVEGWYLPGGGVDRGETMRAAAAREIWEEAGIVANGDLTLFGLYANFKEFKSDHIALYVLRDFRQEARKSAEIAEFGFFSMDALPEGTSVATRARLREWVEGQVPPDYWVTG
ncbi:MAG: NUDIX domain-containing protein [Parvibaculum sp.]